jgi:predicted MFS family arabinose efflux permease
VPYQRRGAAMGRFNAGMFLAIPIGMPLSVWLATARLVAGIFVVQALVAALGCVVGVARRAGRRTGCRGHGTVAAC